MTYDTDYREADITGVDTLTQLTAQGADTPGNFEVPGNVSRITAIRVAASPDWTADTLLGYSSGMQLSGGGIRVGYGAFPGPCGWTASATNAATGSFIGKPVIYKVNIPVIAGGRISCHGVMAGEDCGSLRMNVCLEYDGQPGRIVDYDYREENLTAANTLVSLQTRQGVNNGDFLPVGTIGEIHLDGGLKAVAGPLAATTGFHLSGAGILTAGNYKFVGPVYHTQDDLATLGQSGESEPVKYTMPGIGTKIGSTIRVQAQEIEDDVGTVYAICGFGYL